MYTCTTILNSPSPTRSFVRHWLKGHPLFPLVLRTSCSPRTEGAPAVAGGNQVPLFLSAVTHSADRIYPIGFNSPTWFTSGVTPTTNQRPGCNSWTWRIMKDDSKETWMKMTSPAVIKILPYRCGLHSKIWITDVKPR